MHNTGRKRFSSLCGFFFSGAFGGILAFGIRHMDGVGGKGGWSWMYVDLTPQLDYCVSNDIFIFSFILEGLLTLICTIPALWLVPDFPQYSKLLSTEQRAKWLHRLYVSQGVTNAPLKFTMKQVTRALTDWKTYVYAVIYLGGLNT
jgi:hypothetical protein